MDDDSGTSSRSGRRDPSDNGPITGSEFRRLFSAITDVQGQLSSMKSEISRDRQEANDRLVKRM